MLLGRAGGMYIVVVAGPFGSYGALKAQRLLTSLFVSGFQQFEAPGRLVLLRWCVCNFAWFWGLFSVVWDIFGGLF